MSASPLKMPENGWGKRDRSQVSQSQGLFTLFSSTHIFPQCFSLHVSQDTSFWVCLLVWNNFRLQCRKQPTCEILLSFSHYTHEALVTASHQVLPVVQKEWEPQLTWNFHSFHVTQHFHIGKDARWRCFFSLYSNISLLPTQQWGLQQSFRENKACAAATVVVRKGNQILLTYNSWHF